MAYEPSREQRRVWEFLLRGLPAYGYAVAIFVGGSLSGSGTSPQGVDKVLHFLVFAGFAVVALGAVRFHLPRASASRRRAIAFGLSSVVGGLLEGWQFLLPHRSCELLDWVADTAGAALAMWVVHWLAPRATGTAVPRNAS